MQEKRTNCSAKKQILTARQALMHAVSQFSHSFNKVLTVFKNSQTSKSLPTLQIPQKAICHMWLAVTGYTT